MEAVLDTPTARHLAEILEEEIVTSDNSEGVAPPGFEVFHPIGEGASGRVYMAQRNGSEMPVALKIMKTPLGDGKNAQRAWRELDLLNQIRSKHIPAVLDHGTHRGRLFIATEFIDGPPIDRYVQDNQLDMRTRVELLVKVCQAAGELHNHGVIHRDLKPSNILVTHAGEPVIIDLGIASLLATDVMQTLTAEGAPVGTPAYMAPEQARGERTAVGVRSDVWALGAVCFRVLTGVPPHDLEGMSLYQAVRRVGTMPACNPVEFEPTLPGPLAAVLSKACAFRADDRYATATELAADLRRWLDHHPVEAQPPGAWVKALRWTARHPILATTFLCSVMIAGAAAISGGILYRMAWEPVDVVTNSNETAAWIESRTHRTLTMLYNQPDQGSGAVKAIRVDRPVEFGGGWLAVVLKSLPNVNYRSLLVYDPYRPGEPIWVAPDPGDFPPLDIPSYSGEAARSQHSYNLTSFLTADIFPARPGEEIAIINYGSPDFPGCLRVFGTDLREIYRAWLPGTMSICWLGGEGVFVLAGLNHRLFTPTWTEDDARAGKRPPIFPGCVMILRPVEGQIDTRWVTYKTPGSTTEVERCWVLVQPVTHEHTDWSIDDSHRGFELSLTRPPGEHDPRFTFTISFDAWYGDSISAPGSMWVTNSRLEEVRALEASNVMEADAGFAELISQFGTPRFRFEDAPAFDPNAR